MRWVSLLPKALLPPENGEADCARSATFAEVAEHNDGRGTDMARWRIAALVKVAETGRDHGYQVTHLPRRHLPRGVSRDYELFERDATGFYSYWMSSEGQIHVNWAGAAGATDPVYRASSAHRPTGPDSAQPEPTCAATVAPSRAFAGPTASTADRF